MSKPMTVSTSELKLLLSSLKGNEISSMPPAITQLVNLYRQQYPTSAGEDQPGQVIAAALAAVGRQIIFRNLRRKCAKPKEWQYALAVVATYLEPLLYDYLGEWTIYNAHQLLEDAAWLERWVVSKRKSEEIQAAATQSTRTFKRWHHKGLRIWCEGIRRWLSGETQRSNLGQSFVRPAILVPRLEQQAALQHLFTAALRAGQWLAVTGLPGMGKTTLLGEFVRNLSNNAAYVKRMFPGGVAAVSAERRQTEEHLYLHSLVSQLTGEFFPPPTPPLQLVNQLRAHLAGNRVLLVVDNVPHPTDLKRLRAIHEVMVLIALRSPDDALNLDIPACWRLSVSRMTAGEGRELLCRVSGRESENNQTAQALDTIVALLGGHPLALRLVASRGQSAETTGQSFWRQKLRQLQDLAARQVLLQPEPAELNLAVLLTAFGESLPPRLLQKALLPLLQVPLFSSYDVALGQAVWRDIDSNVALAQRWQELVDWQLVERLDTIALGPGQTGEQALPRYRMHSLIYDFLQEKAPTASYAAQTSEWVWHYPLREVWPEWRPWRVNVPRSSTGLLTHSAWSFRLPGTPVWKWNNIKANLVAMSDFTRERFWSHAWYVPTTPLTWVVMLRRERTTRTGFRIIALVIMSILVVNIMAEALNSPTLRLIKLLLLGITVLTLAWLWWLGEEKMRIYDGAREGQSLEELIAKSEH